MFYLLFYLLFTIYLLPMLQNYPSYRVAWNFRGSLFFFHGNKHFREIRFPFETSKFSHISVGFLSGIWRNKECNIALFLLFIYCTHIEIRRL